MPLIVLMYHRTPKDAGHILDVPLSLFRAQIDALCNASIPLVPFSKALDTKIYLKKPVVSITFDDGHGTNLEAISYLHLAGLPCTSFFVRDFIQSAHDGFMDISAFRFIASRCEVGGHSASHANLCSLSDDALAAELFDSKSFLERNCEQEVTTMSAPGGKLNRRVMRAAINHGYKIIGDSTNFIKNIIKKS